MNCYALLHLQVALLPGPRLDSSSVPSPILHCFNLLCWILVTCAPFWTLLQLAAGMSPSARAAAIAVPVAVGVLLLAGLTAWICVRRRRKQRAAQPRHPKDIESGQQRLQELADMDPARDQRPPRQRDVVSVLAVQ
jgi:type VI protein secretion system component VasK